MADNTGRKQRGPGKPFKPGQSGNPAGRPKGSRNKLGEEFFQAVYAHFMDHGVEAIEQVCQNDPSTYLRVIASILPKEHQDEAEPELTEAERDARIRELHRVLGYDVRTIEPGEEEAGPADPTITH